MQNAVGKQSLAARLFAPVIVTIILAGLAGCPKFEDKGPVSGNDGYSDAVTGDGPQISAIVTPVAPGDWNPTPTRTPRNEHLTWQGDPSSTITVQWAVNKTELGGYTPKVWIVKADEVVDDGLDPVMPFATQFTAEGECKGYSEGFLTIASEGSDFVICSVQFPWLEPDTAYYYRTGTWDDFDFDSLQFSGADLGELHRFFSGAAKGSDRTIRFMAAGDSRGGYEGIRENVERLAAEDLDFWVFSGDMNNTGTQLEWEDWWSSMSSIVNNNVLMPVQGNHEMIANLYYEQFVLPKSATLPENLTEHAWSLDYGNIHFIGLDSTTDDLVAGQRPWLEADLQAASTDPDIDWIIVQYHHPAYSSGNHGSTARVQSHWVPLFEQYGVDLSISGHDHSYERTKPIRNGSVSEDGVVYVVAGGFYAPGYSVGTSEWTVVSVHGDIGNYVIFDVEGTSLHATAYSGDGTEVLDDFTMTK